MTCIHSSLGPCQSMYMERRLYRQVGEVSSWFNKRLKVKVTQSCLTLYHAMVYTVHGILQARILQRVAVPFSGDLPNPGIKPRSPALQEDSLPAEPHGKSKHTGVSSLSLLQRIVLTQESNWGLLHCRRLFSNWAIREAWFLLRIFRNTLPCSYSFPCFT